MQKLFLTTLLLITSSTFAADLNVTQQKQVQHIIDLFKKHNINLITQNISYPLNREEPIPSIDSPKEMKARFNQIFDSKLSQQIANSKPSQWSDVGWRGIMLDNGTIWLDNGKITAINYSSTAEQSYKNQLISTQKHTLYSSLKKFKAPIFQFKTAKFQVRIDEISQGKYRYASWAVNQSQSSKPDLILNNGTVTMDGSGGNHFYTFKSGAFQYIVYRNIMGSSDTADVELTVTKNGKQVLNQRGRLFK